MEGLSDETRRAIDVAAERSLYRWRAAERPPVISHEDLVQELWLWLIERPASLARTSEAWNYTSQRAMFQRTALQLLAAKSLEADTFDGKRLYSVDAIKAALMGASSHRYLTGLLPQALEDLERQSTKYREAIRVRYEDGRVPRDKASERCLYHALTALVKHCNVAYIKDAQAHPTPAGRAVSPESRRASGGYSDPTADLALGLMKAGDVPVELYDGSTTTYREEIMQEGFDQTLGGRVTDGQANPAAMPEGVFDPGFVGQDRADMYRAAVFPELYPDEEEMLIDNWSAQDREEYCGGEYTPGYRRLTLVK